MADLGRNQRALNKDLLQYLPSQGIPALIGLISVPIITRLFPPAVYGDYRTVLVTIGAFSALSVWMASATYRFFPEAEEGERLPDLRVTLYTGLVATLLMLSVLWLGSLLVLGSNLTPRLRTLMLIGLLVMNLNAVRSLSWAFLRARRKVAWYSANVVFDKATSFGVGVALVLMAGSGIRAFLYGAAVASAIAIPISFYVGLRDLPRGGGKISRPLLIEMVRYAGPMVFGQLAVWLLSLSDRYVILWGRGSEEVGLYSAAYGVAEQGIFLVIAAFRNPFAILGARVWEKEGPEATANFVSATARSYMLWAIPAWVGISVLANPIMRVMTDDAYRSAALALPLVAGGLVLFGIQYWYSSSAMFLKKTSTYALSVVLGAVVNVVLNILFVPRFGYMAAAVTTVVAYGVSLVAMARFASKEFRWTFPVASTINALGSGAVMAVFLAVFVTVVDLSAYIVLPIAVLLGVIVYGAGLVALREISRSQVRQAVRRVGNRWSRITRR